MRRTCQGGSIVVRWGAGARSESIGRERADLPIFKVAKARRGARVAGDEDDGLDRCLGRKELLSCDDGADGVGAEVVVEVREGTTLSRC